MVNEAKTSDGRVKFHVRYILSHLDSSERTIEVYARGDGEVRRELCRALKIDGSLVGFSCSDVIIRRIREVQ